MRSLWLFFLLMITVTGSSFASPRMDEPIRPLPLQHAEDLRKAELGRRLFHDIRLSSNNTISCASCHQLNKAGVDGMARSLGVNGAKGSVNAPTVYNSSLQLVQFWDGRAEDLRAQVAGPIHNPIEMASDWQQVMAKLAQDGDYVNQFRQLYPQGMTPDTISQAIAVFEKTLLTPNSSMDRWLRGEEGVLSDSALQGYALFKSYGCVACHQGVNVGGNMYQQMGAMGDYFADRGTPIETSDLGRFNITGRERDRHFFKVPSLRLAALTAPYFHDGTVATLEEAIKLMARYQLGREMPDKDVALIVHFLNSLVGQHEALNP
jgi:cytochrome c peroxidase